VPLPAADESKTPTLEDAAPAQQRINPWVFVPVLYFMQSLPNTMVREVFPSIFKDLGVDNLRIITWVNIIALAWTFKLFWAPLVDVNMTKRLWVLLMQGCCLGGFALLAVGIHLPAFFGVAVAILFIIAIGSATHDIACDGLYLLSLSREQQAGFAGVTTSCFRVGRLLCMSFLLWLAGYLQSTGFSKQNSYVVTLGILAGIYGIGWGYNFFALPRPGADIWSSPTQRGENKLNLLRTMLVVLFGVTIYFMASNGIELIGYLIYGIINRDASNVILPKWDMTGAEIRFAISIVAISIVVAPALFVLVRRLMIGSAMGEAFGSYVRQGGFAAILFFIVFYRFGEAMVSNLSPLFLQDKPEAGGLGLSVAEVGKINGGAGVIGIILGGIAGGVFIAKRGLKRAFWPLVICMHTPNLLYVWAAWAKPHNLWLYVVAFVDQFGYGFGFAGYFVYLMWVAQRGNFRTSHYAIGTGLGALFIALAGIFSGIVQATAMGLFKPEYSYFVCFITVCVCTIPGMLALLIIPMDQTDAKGIRVHAE
jgi:PAT family beta-lactamase induction signal transducer AmpG